MDNVGLLVLAGLGGTAGYLYAKSRPLDLTLSHTEVYTRLVKNAVDGVKSRIDESLGLFDIVTKAV